jgi:L-ascorbate metabolism protein UlaG (beta-lactamase superfamily)
MKVTFYGQACIGVEMNGKNILFDPFISPNAKAAHIAIDQIAADYILLTHAHADHVADVERIGKNNNSTIIANYEVASYYGEKGFNYHPMNHGGKAKFDFGTVKMVNAVHSSVFPDGTYGGNPAGFVIWKEGKSFYHAGDTALTMDMQLIPLTCPALDFAILPIGDNFTMGYEDAVIAADFVKANKAVGIHYDTFPYIEIDHTAAKKTFADSGKELILLSIGESIEL